MFCELNQAERQAGVTDQSDTAQRQQSTTNADQCCWTPDNGICSYRIVPGRGVKAVLKKSVLSVEIGNASFICCFLSVLFLSAQQRNQQLWYSGYKSLDCTQ